MPAPTRTRCRSSATTSAPACPMPPPISPGSIASTSSNAQNKLGGYKNDEVDSLLAEAATKAADDPAARRAGAGSPEAFREDWAFIPWYAQAMSRWATANVKGMEKNLDWQVVAPWDIAIA